MALLTVSCGKNGISDSLSGGDISSHDRNSGVVQAAIGIYSGMQRLGNNITSFSDSSDELTVPPDKSLIRFKMQSSPAASLADSGVLHFVTEYESIANLFHRSNSANYGEPEEIHLEVDKVIVEPAAASNNKAVIPVGIPAKDRTVALKKGRHYIPILRNALVPEGNYKSVTVFFKEPGWISFDGENKYPLYINKSSVKYNKPFSVLKNKITTVHSVPVAEYSSYLASLESGEFNYSKQQKLNSPDKVLVKKLSPQYNFQFNLHETGVTHSGKISEVNIAMKSISAVDASGNTYLLSDEPTTFELMSLLDGAVALMAHNMVPKGTYASFELTLGDNHTVVVEGEPEPLTIEFSEQFKLQFMGPFYLRGGRITEVFLKFDPDRSVFLLENRGYVLDPTIEADSVISLTTEQDLRLIEALGPRSNLVSAEAEVMFEGTVSRHEYKLDKNIYNKTMIYTDMDLVVEDGLRGFCIPAEGAYDNATCPLMPMNELFPLKVIGGSYNGMKLNVTGMPVFKSSDRFLVFLKKYGDRWGIVRGEWGKIDL